MRWDRAGGRSGATLLIELLTSDPTGVGRKNAIWRFHTMISGVKLSL